MAIIYAREGSLRTPTIAITCIVFIILGLMLCISATSSFAAPLGQDKSIGSATTGVITVAWAGAPPAPGYCW